MNGLHTMHIDVGCYVVDALTESEREEFDEHLGHCESCAREVLEFNETAAELAGLAAMGPPRTIRGDTLDSITTVRQLPPVIEWSGPAPEPSRASDDLGPNDARRADAVAPSAATPAAPPVTPSDELAVRRDRRARRNRVLAGLLAAAAVVILALGGLLVNLTQQHQAEVAAQTAAQRQTDLLNAPDAKVLTQTQNGSRFTFVVSKQQDAALLLSSDLPDPGPGKTFQLWTLQGRQPTPDVTMPVGTGSQWFRGPIQGSTSLAVTVEPAGGSTTPTMPILAQVAI